MTSEIETVRLSRLQPGKRNRDVLKVKRKLVDSGFFDGKQNNYFGKGLRSAYRLWQKHLGYETSEIDGIPDEQSLQELGFAINN